MNFGAVNFMEKTVSFLPIANIGQNIVEFEFIPKLDEKAVCMPWFSINPVEGLIMPGDILGESRLVHRDSPCSFNWQ